MNEIRIRRKRMGTEIIWKEEELKQAGFKGIRQIVGEVVNYSVDSWKGESNFGKPGIPRQYCQFDLIDCVLEVCDDPNFVLKGDEYSFRVNLSSSKGSNWELFLVGARKAGIELPEGILNKRVRFVWKDNIRGNIKGGTLVPLEVVSGGSATTTITPQDRALELLRANSSARSFKRAALLDNTISADKQLRESIESGKFIEEMASTGEITLHDNGEDYILPSPAEKPIP